MQQSLFELESKLPDQTQEWGTFKDSLRAPIHSWFTYPAGFSFKAVQASFVKHGIRCGSTVYDPFMGSGTTNLTAKKQGISSYGVEAHPFVFRITQTKMNWEVDLRTIADSMRVIELAVIQRRREFDEEIHGHLEQLFPELILKCYEDKTLLDLWLIREAIDALALGKDVTNFFFVGLVNILRQVSLAGTGWPYIAPKKQKTSSTDKDALYEFVKQTNKMMRDVDAMVAESADCSKASKHHIFNGDSRNTSGLVPSQSADHVFTSPPYLNNFDYADRTRLELYFFGEAKTWGDISRQVRTRLITSATTQIQRDDPHYTLSTEIRDLDRKVYEFLAQSVHRLSDLRLTKGGKKSYDHLVSGYFNDILEVLKDTFRVLKRGAKAVFVLGDSAPYGVHIPTDELIGKLGVAVGFANYEIEVLRTRGGKWKDNPQRHDVALRESIVTLCKA